MNYREINEKTIGIVKKYAKSEITGIDDLLADIGVDSLQMIELIISLEEAFDFEFDPGEMNYTTLKSIKSIAEYVNKKISN